MQTYLRASQVSKPESGEFCRTFTSFEEEAINSNGKQMMDHEDTNKELTREISNSLKSGPGIMIKIASKWADAEVNKMDISREIL